MEVVQSRMRSLLAALILSLSAAATAYVQVPPCLKLYHFDVNTGDATLILSPEGSDVHIDAGNRVRGTDPIKEFLDRAKADGHPFSLD